MAKQKSWLETVTGFVKRKMQYYNVLQYARYTTLPRYFIEDMITKKKLKAKRIDGELSIERQYGRDMTRKIIKLYEKEIGGSLGAARRHEQKKKAARREGPLFELGLKMPQPPELGDPDPPKNKKDKDALVIDKLL